jgi:drug/metabolite transporter (DMT)-like permease
MVTLILGTGMLLNRNREKMPSRRDIAGLALLGMLNPFLAFLLESHGMVDTSASLTSIILSTMPLLTPFAAFIVWRERVVLRNFLGLLLSFAGLALIFLWGSGPAEYSLRGLAMLSTSVLTGVIYGILAKRLVGRVSPVMIVTWQQGFGFVFYLPLFFAFTDHSVLPAAGIGLESLFAIVFLAIFPSALAYIIYVGGIQKIGPTRTNAFINLSPVVTYLASFLILGEALGVAKLIGIAVVIAGVFISQSQKRAG